MAVFTDGKHLVASNLKQLHEFAEEIGLKKEWFQNHPRHPHYDLTTKNKCNMARICGAGFMRTRTIINAFQNGIFKNE